MLNFFKKNKLDENNSASISKETTINSLEKQPEKRIEKININENYIEFDGKRLSFPLSLEDIHSAFSGYGEIEEIKTNSSIYYNLNSQGIVFQTCDMECVFLKYRKAFVDYEHNIVYCMVYHGDEPRKKYSDDVTLPKTVSSAEIYFDEKPLSKHFTTFDFDNVGVFSSKIYKVEGIPNFKENGQPNVNISLSYTPERPPSGGSYNIKKCKEEVLEFDNFNFKLAILQELIYNLELITPFFNINEFADQYTGKEIDTESETPIKPAIQYFKKLPIPKRLADEITEIYMDGGNDIYMNIAPFWGGDEEYFDLNDISVKELSQFKNLKKATLMTSEFEKVSATFNELGIETEML